jgi:hypothetical protein
LPDIALEDIKTCTEMGRQVLRFLKEEEHNKVKYIPRKLTYHFKKDQPITTSFIDESMEVHESYSKIDEEDIKLVEEWSKARMEPSDDTWIFDDPKYKVKPIIRPVVVPEVNKEVLENELLKLFSTKRVEPEKSETIEPAKKVLAVENDDYMECYPVADDYKEINEDPELGEKVKELFESEEQAKQDQKWEQQRRKNFLFGGTTQGKKKGRGKYKDDVNKIEKVRSILIRLVH